MVGYITMCIVHERRTTAVTIAYVFCATHAFHSDRLEDGSMRDPESKFDI